MVDIRGKAAKIRSSPTTQEGARLGAFLRERDGQFRCIPIKNRLLRVFPEKANDQFRCKMSFANVQNRCVFIPTNRNLLTVAFLYLPEFINTFLVIRKPED